MNLSNRQQTIEQLTERYTNLNIKKIRTESDLQHSKDQLEELKREAMSLWGTDDIKTLEAKLLEMRNSNEKKLTDYQNHLDEIETKLKGIEEGEFNPEGTF